MTKTEIQINELIQKQGSNKLKKLWVVLMEERYSGNASIPLQEEKREDAMIDKNDPVFLGMVIGGIIGHIIKSIK